MKSINLTNTVVGIASVVLAVVALVIFFKIISLDTFLARQTPITKIYYADNISPAHELLIRRFNLHYQGQIEVLPVNLPFSKFSTNERKEILARSLRSKTDCMDIFAVDRIWIPRFARWALPLDRYFKKMVSHINPYALASCYDNDRLVAIPLYVDIGVMYYRQDLLRQLPGAAELEEKITRSLTWREFIRLGMQIRHTEKPFYLFPGKNFEGLMCCFHEMLHAPRQNLFERDSLNLNVPECRKVLQVLVDLINRYQLTPGVVTNFDDHDSYIYALKNDALFIRGWPGFRKHYRAAIEDTTKIDNFRMAPLPHFEGQQQFAVFGGWNLMISKDSKHKDACVKFLEFTMRRDIQKMLFEKGGYLSINNKLYEDSAFVRSHRELKFFQQLFKHGKHRPRRVDYTRISDILSYYINAALKNEISIPDALQLASDRINSDQTFIK